MHQVTSQAQELSELLFVYQQKEMYLLLSH